MMDLAINHDFYGFVDVVVSSGSLSSNDTDQIWAALDEGWGEEPQSQD